MLRSSMAALAILGLAALAQTAHAQRYTPPGGPELPYYLDYFRPQVGVLDQYNQFVAPKAQLSSQLQYMTQQQNADYRAIEKQIQETKQIRRSAAAPTGTSAGFMNYSHYYGSSAQPGTRPRPQFNSLPSP